MYRSTVAVTVAAITLTGACEQRIAPRLDPDATDWVEYRNDRLGFSTEYPDRYEVRVRDNSVEFRDGRVTAIRVTLADAREAREHGLWESSSPVRAARMGGVDGAFYRYKHYDGPTYVPTLAVVVPHRDRYLGVEVRTSDPELDPVHLRLVESVRLW